MKKTNLIMMLLLGAQISVDAQVTINSSDNPLAAGYSYTLKGIPEITSISFSPGASGPDAFWDFSTMGNGAITYPFTITACTGSECDSFPGTSFKASANIFDMYIKEYYVRGTSNIEYNGSTSGNASYNLFSVYSNSKTAVVFPLTYNTTFTDTYSYDEGFFNAGEITHHTSVSFEGIADAYGTIKTPTGTYNNVIRVQVYTNDDYSKAESHEEGNYYTTIYSWYQKGIGEPVVTIKKVYRIGYVPNVGVNEYTSYSYYYTTTLPKNETSINGSLISERSVEVYPNPARNQINIKRENGNIKKISIANIFGTNIYQREIKKDEAVVSVNTSTWTAGLYFVNVEYKDGRVSIQKVVIE